MSEERNGTAPKMDLTMCNRNTVTGKYELEIKKKIFAKNFKNENTSRAHTRTRNTHTLNNTAREATGPARTLMR